MNAYLLRHIYLHAGRLPPSPSIFLPAPRFNLYNETVIQSYKQKCGNHISPLCSTLHRRKKSIRMICGVNVSYEFIYYGRMDRQNVAVLLFYGSTLFYSALMIISHVL